MKKILSILLALVLVVGTIEIGLNTVIALSSESVLSDPDDNFITVFDSNAYLTDDATTTNTNPELIMANDKGYWLGGNSWLSANPLAQDGLYMGKNGETAKILERNNVSVQNVDDFEWQFQMISDNAQKINTSFVFHIGPTANISSYASKNNLFSVSLFGSEVDTTKHCAVSDALVVEYGGNEKNTTLGNMRPYDYDSSVTPWIIKDNSYLKLDDDSANKKIDLTKYITVKIKMDGKKIIVSVWQSKDKEGTYRELTVEMYSSVAKKFNGGDFAIISGADTCNYRVKDMNISTPREVFNSNDYPAPEHVNTEIKTETDAGLWLENARISTIAANKDRLYMDSWKATNEVLSRNKADTENLIDFEWQFDFLGNGTNSRSAFMFHTNDNSKITGTNAYWDRNYAFSLMVWGSDWSYVGTANKAATDYAMPHSIALQVPFYDSSNSDMMGKPRPLGGYEKDTTTNKFKHSSKDSYLELGSIDLSKWMTVTIKMVGDTVKLTVKQGTIELNKEFVIPQNNLSLAPMGDVAVIQGGNQSGYRNMTIKTLEKDIDVPKPEEPTEPEKPQDPTKPEVSKDYEELPSTGIYYENDFEETQDGIVFGITPKYPEECGLKKEKNGNGYLQIGHDYSNANGKDGWTSLKITPDKKYKDFTLNFNIKLDPELNNTFHQNWHYLLVGFRSQNGVVDSNILQIASGGAAFAIADKSEGKDYTNNRIAYSGNNSTLGYTFDLPNGNSKAGLSPDGVWHRISLVVDGFTYKYYLDGVLMMEVEDTHETYEYGSIVIMSRTLTIQIDDVEILSPKAEISPFEPEQSETGLLYENNFDTEDDANRVNVVRGQNYGIVTEGEKKYYHIDYEPDVSNAVNGPVNMTFGPSGIKDFTLNMDVRITKKVDEKWHSVILMGRTKGGISAQARLFTKGSLLAVQSGTEVLEVARSGPAAENTTSTNPCHDRDAGVSTLEWHKVSLVCEGWKYTVYIDGQKILEGIDEHQLNKWGGFGLRTQGVNLDIDNIRIWGTPDYDLEYKEEEPTGVLYSNDFEKNQDGIVFGTKPKYPKDSGLKEEKSGNGYLQLGHDYSHPNGTDGWSTLNITPDKKYKNFTFNFKIKLDPELNKNYHQNWHFLLVGFRSENSIYASNVLQMSSSGATFSVADNSKGKNYTNNRIAYSGSKSTLGGTFDLPNGNAKAGISPDGVWHKVSVVADGFIYRYYLDGVLMLEAEDTTKTYKSGSIVIMGRSLTLQIDDVEILPANTEITPFEPQQTETGLLYENTFQNDGDQERVNVVRGQNYGIVTEGEEKYYHIDYEPDASNAANGPLNMTFGPSGIKDFTLNMNVRITKKIDLKWHSIILMGRTKSGGISSQARFFAKGTLLVTQKDTELLEIARSGPAAPNTTSTNPSHDTAAGVSILEWHKVSLVCEDWKYTAYIDGKKIVEGLDEHKLNKWGGFTLRTQGVNLDIDDIRIWGTPHYDIGFTEEVPEGTLYKNDFEDSSLEGIEFTYYDDEKTSVMSEENSNKFLRAYPNLRVKEDGKPEVVGNGNLLFTFGPPNTMNFELTYKLRLMSNTNENLGSAIVGIHSMPSNIKYDSVWFNMLPRGSSVSLKDSKRVLGIDNLIATTGKNRSGGTAYMPSDNRAKGIRPDGKWHDIKVVVKDYTYTLFIDGTEVLSATDKDKTFYKGYTVIGSNGCIIDVDNINLVNK